MKNIFKQLKQKIRSFHINQRFSRVRTKVTRFIDKHPLRSFFAVLGILLLLIVLSNILQQPAGDTSKTKQPTKTVSVYRIGEAPKITVSAQTKKSGVIEIVAQTSGVVQTINFYEGGQFNKGDMLLGLSSNYQGGNSFSVQRQLAQAQYNGTVNTYPIQKELIQKQREIAEKTDTNADQLRDITNTSINETKNMISINEAILRSIEQDLNSSTPNTDAYEALQRMQLQYTVSLNQARQALRSSEQQAGNDNPPAQLSNLGKDVTLKQLELQEKQLDISREVSRLQLQLAQVQEGVMFPTAPFGGTVQRVYVKQFETVNPGTKLMVIAQHTWEDPITAVAYVPRDIAQKISRLEPSILHLGDKTYSTIPYYVSTEAVQGSLYAVYYPIPDGMTASVVNSGFISIEIPIGYYQTSAAVPYIPIDAVYQTRENAYVFVDNKGKVATKTVTLGPVIGSYVEITKGISAGDAIILNRNVVEGDVVKGE